MPRQQCTGRQATCGCGMRAGTAGDAQQQYQICPEHWRLTELRVMLLLGNGGFLGRRRAPGAKVALPATGQGMAYAAQACRFSETGDTKERFGNGIVEAGGVVLPERK